MKTFIGAGAAAILILAASVGYAQDERIADAGTFLNDDQIEQVLVGVEFTGSGIDKGKAYTWWEKYKKDGTIYSHTIKYSSGGTYVIKDGAICIDYSDAVYDDYYTGCYQIRLVSEDGSEIEYVRGDTVTKGSRN